MHANTHAGYGISDYNLVSASVLFQLISWPWDLHRHGHHWVRQREREYLLARVLLLVVVAVRALLLAQVRLERLLVVVVEVQLLLVLPLLLVSHR